VLIKFETFKDLKQNSKKLESIIRFLSKQNKKIQNNVSYKLRTSEKWCKNPKRRKLTSFPKII
jgi:hypothetical protein